MIVLVWLIIIATPITHEYDCLHIDYLHNGIIWKGDCALPFEYPHNGRQ